MEIIRKVAGFALIAIIVVGVIALGARILQLNFRSDEIEEQKEYKITFQYNSDLEKQYALNIEGERKIISTSDIMPNINTSVIGQSKHTVEIDGEEIVMNVIVDDLRKLKLSGPHSIDISKGASDIVVEQIIRHNLLIEGPENYDDIEINIAFPEKFNTSKTGKIGTILVTGKYKDNKLNSSEFRFNINVPTEVAKKDNEPATNPQPKNPDEPIDVPERPSGPVTKPGTPKLPDDKPERPSGPVTRPGTPVIPDKRPERPERPEVKPEEPLTARFPLLYPELLPEGAEFMWSSIKVWVEEFHVYNLRRELTEKTYIQTAHIIFNENVPYSVRLFGRDENDEILSMNYLLESKELEYDWQLPDITVEEELKKIAQQFAAAFGF